jgi:hypothetical protein
MTERLTTQLRRVLTAVEGGYLGAEGPIASRILAHMRGALSGAKAVRRSRRRVPPRPAAGIRTAPRAQRGDTAE